MKKLQLLVTSVLICCIFFCGCGEKQDTSNTFEEMDGRKVFSKTYKEFFADYNNSMQEESQKISEVDWEEADSPEFPWDILSYDYSSAEDPNQTISYLILQAHTDSKNVASVSHSLFPGQADKTTAQQWTDRSKTFILSLDQDMDDKEIDTLFKELGVFQVLESDGWTEEFENKVERNGILYQITFQMEGFEYSNGLLSLFFQPQQ